MLMKIWAVMAPVLACAGVGYFWGRTGRPFDTRTECGDPRPMAFLWERASPAKGAKPRQDTRDISNGSTNSVSGIPPGG